MTTPEAANSAQKMDPVTRVSQDIEATYPLTSRMVGEGFRMEELTGFLNEDDLAEFLWQSRFPKHSAGPQISTPSHYGPEQPRIQT